ncbi:MAG: prepilin-type N-terminal cleavage/methylation domain-containing protein [Ruminococcus sp.]|nr:prepilin-type N-terminal cleavage/methylation domain-containing protein [Ruminococcus sp.]
MKTTKKGFTLIELIVVIAIIGVLAAILVPSMLGYVKKSKIQGANSTANTLLKAVNSAATDMDEDDESFDDGTLTFTKTVDSAGAKEYIRPFFSDIDSVDAQVEIENGIAIASAVRSGKYFGSFPAVYSAKSYPDNASLEGALTDAINKAKGTSTGSTGSTGG